MNTGRYAIYDKVTGVIRRIVFCHHTLAPLQPKEGEDIIEIEDGISDVTHYVSSTGVTTIPEIVSIPDQISQGELVRMPDLPAGSTVRIVDPDGNSTLIQESNVELRFVDPGEYEIEVQPGPFPKKTKKLKVNRNAV